MISILLPVFNAAPFLRACLDSILKQSLENWELLAVDDFSTDDSWQTLREFAEIDARISIYKNNEKGIIPALRLAFHHSQGEFITRMDADDLMPVDKLTNLHLALLKEGVGHVITGKVTYFSDVELGLSLIHISEPTRPY